MLVAVNIPDNPKGKKSSKTSLQIFQGKSEQGKMVSDLLTLLVILMLLHQKIRGILFYCCLSVPKCLHKIKVKT